MLTCPRVTQFVNDGSGTLVWLPLSPVPQFLTSAPWSLERMGSRPSGLFDSGREGKWGETRR